MTTTTENEAPRDPNAALDELDNIRARARLLQLALMGSNSGVTIDSGRYRDAILQQACDIADGLDKLDAALSGGSTS